MQRKLTLPPSGTVCGCTDRITTGGSAKQDGREGWLRRPREVFFSPSGPRDPAKGFPQRPVLLPCQVQAFWCTIILQGLCPKLKEGTSHQVVCPTLCLIYLDPFGILPCSTINCPISIQSVTIACFSTSWASLGTQCPSLAFRGFPGGSYALIIDGSIESLPKSLLSLGTAHDRLNHIETTIF